MWAILACALVCCLLLGCAPQAITDDVSLSDPGLQYQLLEGANSVILRSGRVLASSWEDDKAYVFTNAIGEDPVLIAGPEDSVRLLGLVGGQAFWQTTRSDGSHDLVRYDLGSQTAKVLENSAGATYELAGDRAVSLETTLSPQGGFRHTLRRVGDGSPTWSVDFESGSPLLLPGVGDGLVALHVPQGDEPSGPGVTYVIDAGSGELRRRFERGEGTRPWIAGRGVIWAEGEPGSERLLFAASETTDTVALARSVNIEGWATPGDGRFYWLDPDDQSLGRGALRWTEPLTGISDKQAFVLPADNVATSLIDASVDMAVVAATSTDAPRSRSIYLVELDSGTSE